MDSRPQIFKLRAYESVRRRQRAPHPLLLFRGLELSRISHLKPTPPREVALFRLCRGAVREHVNACALVLKFATCLAFYFKSQLSLQHYNHIDIV